MCDDYRRVFHKESDAFDFARKKGKELFDELLERDAERTLWSENYYDAEYDTDQEEDICGKVFDVIYSDECHWVEVFYKDIN